VLESKRHNGIPIVESPNEKALSCWIPIKVTLQQIKVELKQ
jgi:hypothetical protein